MTGLEFANDIYVPFHPDMVTTPIQLQPQNIWFEESWQCNWYIQVHRQYFQQNGFSACKQADGSVLFTRE